MSDKVELYDGEYGNYDSDIYRQVRIETYGVDFGQTSWVTNEESEQIPGMLELTRNSSVLEIGCGSGVYALHLAQTIGCSVTGLDINALGVRNANQLALQQRPGSQVGLQYAMFPNPCHLQTKPSTPFSPTTCCATFREDRSVLAEMYRVLKPGGRPMLFSDALIIGGIDLAGGDRHPQLDRLLFV